VTGVQTCALPISPKPQNPISHNVNFSDYMYYVPDILGARRGFSIGYEVEEGQKEEAAGEYFADNVHSILEIEVLSVARGPGVEGQSDIAVPLDGIEGEDWQVQDLSLLVCNKGLDRLGEDVHWKREEAAPAHGVAVVLQGDQDIVQVGIDVVGVRGLPG